MDSRKLLFPQKEVHCPAAASVRAGATQVVEDGVVGATGLFQGVGQDGEAVEAEVTRWKDAIVVSGMSKRAYRRPALGAIS